MIIKILYNPKFKKIIFFPIVQICLYVILLTYRIKDFIKDLQGDAFLARPAAVLSSITTISYILIFAFTNKIFTKFEKETEIEREGEVGIETRDTPRFGLFELERKKVDI